MPEPRGGSMSLLKGLKRTLPELGKVRASLEEAERQILPAAKEELQERLTAGHEEASREIRPGSATVLSLDVHQSVSTDASHEIQQQGTQERLLDVPQRKTLLAKKKKKYSTTFTLRMDLDLHKRLREISEFNELEMTAIINEAIEFHLGNFEAPPANWKRPRR